MTRYTITPWRSQADLLDVRQQLYPSNATLPDQRRRAVARVMAWKLRGNLPHAVESTALLVDAILHHNPAINSSFSIRAVYSAAFCRFVTGFCDIGRHRERALEPSSMLDIAKQIDMPAEFVALRHEATHEELPGLQRLMDATNKALEWLWRVYWSRIESSNDVESIEGEDAPLRNKVAMILRGHRKAARDRLLSKKRMKHEPATHAQQTCEALFAVCPDRQQLSSVLTQALVEDGLLFPADRELNSSLEGSYLIWDSLIAEMQLRSRSNFVHEMGLALLQYLISSSARRPGSDNEKEALAEWTVHLASFSSAREGGGEQLAEEVMTQCCLHPGFWTQKAAMKLLAMSDDDFRDQWSDLIDAGQVGINANELPSSANEEQMDVEAGSNVPSENADMDAGSMDGEQVVTWTRSILPPLVPIGVVK